MSGCNRKGPQGLGPLTGMKRGICNQTDNETEQQPANICGVGRRQRRGNGKRGLARGMKSSTQ